MSGLGAPAPQALGRGLAPMSTSAPQYHSDEQEALQKVPHWCNVCCAWVSCEWQESSLLQKVLRNEAGCEEPQLTPSV